MRSQFAALFHIFRFMSASHFTIKRSLLPSGNKGEHPTSACRYHLARKFYFLGHLRHLRHAPPTVSKRTGSLLLRFKADGSASAVWRGPDRIQQHRSCESSDATSLSVRPRDATFGQPPAASPPASSTDQVCHQASGLWDTKLQSVAGLVNDEHQTSRQIWRRRSRSPLLLFFLLLRRISHRGLWGSKGDLECSSFLSTVLLCCFQDFPPCWFRRWVTNAIGREVWNRKSVSESREH